MGGRGSGGRNSKRKLRDVQRARLDVHELARDSNLKLGRRGTLFGSIGFEIAGSHLTADATSCSYVANVAARRVFSMLDMRISITASGFSPAANAPGLLISRRWATVGIARLAG
jgi:hypothetical protein